MTAAMTQPLSTQAPAGEPPLWPITIKMFMEMVRLGIVSEKAPVYLWKGRLARRMAPHRPHSITVLRTSVTLRAMVPAGYSVESEQPMSFRHEHSAPQPDVMVIRGRSEDYLTDFPTTADIPLIVEVSDSTLPEDRKLVPIYAEEGIPVYWLINIPDRRIEVYDDLIAAKDGAAAHYGRCTPYSPDAEVPIVLDGREVGTIRLRDLLP